jgi:hypothetical protein
LFRLKRLASMRRQALLELNQNSPERQLPDHIGKMRERIIGLLQIYNHEHSAVAGGCITRRCRVAVAA